MKMPFLGCAYYPEDWNESEIEKDIAKMREAGISCVRLAEFAWHKMEPTENEYNFTWLHNVIDKLFDNGISVILGTPTATPPRWLSKKYPDIFSINESGVSRSFGGRCDCCSSNNHYLEACDKIVRKMGEEFGSDKNVIAWQIDNEVYVRSNCFCNDCVRKFREHLRDKYKTVENLNKEWNLELWSQAYDSFEDIPAAGTMAWHNFHLTYEWEVSHHKSNIDFIHRQADILRKYTTAPIGTDMMPLNGMDYEQTVSKLDIVMFNHYTEPKDIFEEIFWFNFLRTLKDDPFLVTETWATWNGSTSIGQVLKPEGVSRLNSSLPVCLGGMGNMYWLWRQHWAGHELMHGSLVSPQGRETHVFPEIQKTADEFENLTEYINSSTVQTKAAVHFTAKSWNLFKNQKVYEKNNYLKNVVKFATALTKNGVLPDVIGAIKDLSKYKLIFSPLLMTLEDGNLNERIKDWVYNGGVWVAGPMSDIRNYAGAHYKDKAMGISEDITNAKLLFSIPTDGSVLKAKWQDGEELVCESWVEIFENNAFNNIATVTDGHSSLNGKTVVGMYKYGKGTVILNGTLMNEDGLKKLIKVAVKEADIKENIADENIVSINRTGDRLILCEVEGRKGMAKLSCKYQNVLTNEIFEDEIEISPFDIVYLQKV